MLLLKKLREREKFCQKFEEYGRVPRHDVKVILGDLNTEVDKEEHYSRTVGKESLYENSNDNGLRLISFAINKEMMVQSIWLQRKNIKKMAWQSLGRMTEH